jgi:ferredoxin-type protein NapH
LDGEIKRKLLKYNTPRRIVQFLSFLFLSSIVFNLGSLQLLLPVLWTWGLPQNTAGDAFTAIQLMFSRWKGIYFAFPWLGVASFLVVGILIGKSMCGWVCPFGFIQDLLVFIKRKKMEFAPRTHNSAVYAKYVVLAVTLFISATFAASTVAGSAASYRGALGTFVDAPFTTLSPAETLFATLPRAVNDFRNQTMTTPVANVLAGIVSVPALFWAQFVILIGVLVFAVYVPRSWCKYLCPHGAIMAILNRFSFIGLRRELVGCTKVDCRACVEVCPMRVPILDLPWEKFSHPECIYCMKCVDACENKAIKLTYP